MAETVLITGAFGLVGSEVVRRFALDGWRVVATAHRTVAALPAGAEPVQVDLTDADQVQRVVAEVSSDVIVHLAAVIPPLIYYNGRLGRRVNVDATAALLQAAERLPNPPRFVHASSGSVYGSRNPHRHPEPVTADTPTRPCELYGGQKLEAEQLVRASNLDWVMMRLGGVLSVDLSATPFTKDTLYFGSAMPADGRVHCIDSRDVATAFAAATEADVVGETLLIAGDDSHRLLQGGIGSALAAAHGMPGAMPAGLPGNPDSDDDWYPNDWMDTARAQQLLKFQHYSWPDMLAEIRDRAGWMRYPRRVIAPMAHQFVKRQGAYRKSPRTHADVWGALRARFGEVAVDTAGAE
ncbi:MULTISPECIES: NAD-dependent epimerase/dehydratase family protein [Mycobacterium]|uniref:Oxidoreductase n=1 Tax=Mycobacterium kiyosense TaxID=2871094 RepID=A0A9P3UWM5_9MYCO|nr:MULTISPECIES: NAD(P)-dependent oxidoreductase [Mycobacterium]BDB43599.1 oxidoreductase [Mycobacterium kiyosense]BDE13243.1 oxidoreductase [Mycobacterium sp. 20KCMC460]GLB90656.1 oxidoreductase [Mycobacterium kiyosense]GLB96550.1 oxidoreductase [Mycobacterium kiyosense]GLC03154.1 oxidoreductase [Mycobacterium kiyosense]